MIKTIGDLLEELRAKELEALERHREVPHPSIIGDMFEGLTRDLARRALFAGMDLRVETGIIKGPDGAYSRQIDCMIVQGEGDRVPYTEHRVYSSDQVFAVVEVKTNLYGREIADAYENLLSVARVGRKRFLRNEVIDRNYRTIVREALPENPEDLPYWKEMIYHALVVEATQPARIVLGHFGYVDETSLRSGFTDFLGRNVTVDPEEPKKGFGPTSLPDLILCRDAGLVKVNGLPYSSPLGPDGRWLLLFSFQGRPFTYLLEVLWTRLRLDLPIPREVFGDDLELDPGSPLLFAKAVQKGNASGWMYDWHDVTREELEKGAEPLPWEPVEITLNQSVFLHALGVKEAIDPNEPDLLEFLRDRGEDPESLIKELEEAGLVYRDGAGLVRYLTDQCAVVTLPDGRIVAGDDGTGRLQRWALQQMRERRQGQE